MERGPLALFGAIVAVGVGPALWLGAQLGAADLAPGQRPIQVDEQFPGVDLDFGGAGAGELPDDAEPLATYSYTPLAEDPAGISPEPEPTTSATVDPGPARVPPPSPPSPSPPPATPSPSISDSVAPPADPGPSETSWPEPSDSDVPDFPDVSDGPVSTIGPVE